MQKLSTLLAAALVSGVAVLGQAQESNSPAAAEAGIIVLHVTSVRVINGCVTRDKAPVCQEQLDIEAILGHNKILLEGNAHESFSFNANHFIPLALGNYPAQFKDKKPDQALQLGEEVILTLPNKAIWKSRIIGYSE